MELFPFGSTSPRGMTEKLQIFISLEVTENFISDICIVRIIPFYWILNNGWCLVIRAFQNIEYTVATTPTDLSIRSQVEQECIPAGCVPSAAVAVSPATHAPLPYTPLTYHTHPLPCMPPCHIHPTAMHAPPRSEFLTHACENITFPQLLLRTVKMTFL